MYGMWIWLNECIIYNYTYPLHMLVLFFLFVLIFRMTTDPVFSLPDWQKWSKQQGHQWERQTVCQCLCNSKCIPTWWGKSCEPRTQLMQTSRAARLVVVDPRLAKQTKDKKMSLDQAYKKTRIQQQTCSFFPAPWRHLLLEKSPMTAVCPNG